ncbi:MAG: hypothetical protein ACJ71P_14350 [Nitrososphaeraceae archaeon]
MAEGLKKAGFFGGTRLVREKAGTSNMVLPSTVSPVSSIDTLTTKHWICIQKYKSTS